MTAKCIIKVPYVEKKGIKRALVDKEFEIFIIPNWFTVNYPKYFKEREKVFKLTNKMADTSDLSELDKLTEDLKAQNLESTHKLKYALIESVLIANEYEYDSEWWDKKIDPVNADDFIVQCVMKTIPDEDKKKVLKALLEKSITIS